MKCISCAPDKANSSKYDYLILTLFMLDIIYEVISAINVCYAGSTISTSILNTMAFSSISSPISDNMSFLD